MVCYRQRLCGGVLSLLALTWLGCGAESPPPVADVSPRRSEPVVAAPLEAAATDDAVATEIRAVAPEPIGVAETASAPVESSAPTAPAATADSGTATTEPGGATATTSGPTTNTDAMEIPFAKEGTPEWRLYEIARLIVPPATQKQVVDSDGQATLVDRSVDEITSDRRHSLQQVVSHAGQIIAATHADAAQEALFGNAVHYLSSAYVELAVMGEAESARKLSELAEALFAQKPQSSATVEASARLLELAERMGQLHGGSNSEWTRAHATQARLFASRFPLETSRCVAALIDAGRACEQASLTTDARSCYLLLVQQFGDTPFAESVAPIARRLNLVGQTLGAQDFGGPTIDGGFVSIDQFRGHAVLIVFWSAESASFAKDFPQLQTLQEQQGDQLAIVGVNLDVDESKVDRFLESHPLQWRQIFAPDSSRRGTQNPVASYYGVTTVPQYWLIDPQGKVLAAPADLGKLPL
ncbi:MAG: TlpA family protein disulfide reductase [Planctomycetaceae bacterium]